MATFINDIELDYSTPVPRTRDFITTDEDVQSVDFDNITRHVKKVLPEFTLTCAFTSDVREANFQSILDLADAKSTIKLTQTQVYENMIITSISETGTYTDTIEFNITLKQVNTVVFEVSDVALPSKVQEVQDTSSKGTQATTEIEIIEPSFLPSGLGDQE